MTRHDQPGDQVCADMARGANHYCTQDRAPVPSETSACTHCGPSSLTYC
jgi:hypothetical protein